MSRNISEVQNNTNTDIGNRSENNLEHGKEHKDLPRELDFDDEMVSEKLEKVDSPDNSDKHWKEHKDLPRELDFDNEKILEKLEKSDSTDNPNKHWKEHKDLQVEQDYREEYDSDVNTDVFLAEKSIEEKQQEILEGTYEPNSCFEVDGVKYYTDDNGKVFRVNDTLLPNASFEVNGYTYKTDEKGRVISAEGILYKKDDDYKRKMETVNKEEQDYQKGDDRGHLIGHQFGGSDNLENLVPMDSEFNRHGDFAKLENTLRQAVDNGDEVYVKIEPVYEGDSNRPVGFKVTYTIDGETETVYMKNGGEE